MARVKVCQSLIQPREYKVASHTQENVTYEVIPSTIWTDGICSCPDFEYRGGQCKHIKAVEDQACDFVADVKFDDTRCPKCGDYIAELELTPEFD